MIRLGTICLVTSMVAIFLSFPSYALDVNKTEIAGKSAMPLPVDVGGKSAMPLSPPSIEEPEPMSIIDTLKDRGVYDTFLSDVEKTGLTKTMSGQGPLTVFAPRDDAFDNLEDTSKEKLSKNIKSLTSILKYHLVSENYSANDLVKHGSLKTIQGDNITISEDSMGNLMVNGETPINEYGIICTNGVIYPVEILLIPEDLRGQIKQRAIISNTHPISSPTSPVSSDEVALRADNEEVGRNGEAINMAQQMPIQGQQQSAQVQPVTA
jgi:uncharacterized surface protein with fasciclin (FAS1) repeats